MMLAQSHTQKTVGVRMLDWTTEVVELGSTSHKTVRVANSTQLENTLFGTWTFQPTH